jgi:hypothetical protein
MQHYVIKFVSVVKHHKPKPTKLMTSMNYLVVLQYIVIILYLTSYCFFVFREGKDGFIVYNIHCTLPMLMFCGEFYYTYCVKRHNEVIWEHFAYKGRLTEKGNNRCLKLPSDFKRGKRC